jgi:hypothetical protein
MFKPVTQERLEFGGLVCGKGSRRRLIPAPDSGSNCLISSSPRVVSRDAVPIVQVTRPLDEASLDATALPSPDGVSERSGVEYTIISTVHSEVER